MDLLDRFMRDLVGPNWRIHLYLLALAYIVISGTLLVLKKSREKSKRMQPAMSLPTQPEKQLLVGPSLGRKLRDILRSHGIDSSG